MAAPLVNIASVPGVPLADTFGTRSRVRGWWNALDVIIPAAVLLALLFFCFLWPLIYHLPPAVHGNILAADEPMFSRGHIFGTDSLGNDLMAQLLYGGRVSFEVGGATQFIGLVIGLFFGILAANRGGILDAVIMRILDVFIAFPSLVLILAIADGLGASELHVIWALSAFSIPAFARLARAATLRLREQTFMVASRLSGTRERRAILRHIVPNILPQIFTFALLGAGVAIILEGALDYLGYGIPPPGLSWGNMISSGQAYLSNQPREVLLPSAALLITVIALNALGDSIRVRWGGQ